MITVTLPKDQYDNLESTVKTLRNDRDALASIISKMDDDLKAAEKAMVDKVTMPGDNEVLKQIQRARSVCSHFLHARRIREKR